MASQDEYQQQQFFKEDDFWDDLPNCYQRVEFLSVEQLIERYPNMTEFQIEQLHKLSKT